MPLQIHLFPCLSDNFGYLAHDPGAGATVAVDVPDGEKVIAEVKAKGWKLTDIWITHHHPDHVQGLAALKAFAPQARVVGPRAEADKIAGLEVLVGEGDLLKLGESEARVIETPGHTAGHVVYYFADDEVLFSGDTLFSLGCGRVFETPPQIMYASLCKLIDEIPEETRIYCGHEYTLSNAKFALTIEPGNEVLSQYAGRVKTLREKGEPTIPTTMRMELAANPFLRAEIPEVQAAVGLSGADSAVVFAEIRERKNKA